jgi:hypothetical protein
VAQDSSCPFTATFKIYCALPLEYVLFHLGDKWIAIAMKTGIAVELEIAKLSFGTLQGPVLL